MCKSPVSHSNKRWPHSFLKKQRCRWKDEEEVPYWSCSFRVFGKVLPEGLRMNVPWFDFDTHPSQIHRPQRATGQGAGKSGQGEALNPPPSSSSSDVKPPLPAKVKRPLAQTAGMPPPHTSTPPVTDRCQWRSTVMPKARRSLLRASRNNSRGR